MIFLKEKIQKLTDECNQIKDKNKQLKDENNQLEVQFQKKKKKKSYFFTKIYEIKLPTFNEDEDDKEADKKESELSFDIIKAILASYEQQIKTKNQNKTILHLGCESKNIQVAKHILSLNKVDINKEFTENNISKIALHISVENNDIKTVKLLLELPNTNVNIMLNQSTNQNISSNTNSYYGRSSTSIVYNTSSSLEKTALNIAVENKFIEIVQLLLKHPKIDVNILSKKYKNETMHQSTSGSNSSTIEKSALQIAIEKNNIDIINLLLAHQNIDVNVLYKNIISESRHYDNSNNNTATKEIIIEKTPLYFAIEKNHFEISMKLLNHPKINANILSKNNEKSSYSSSSKQTSNSSYYSNNYHNNYNTSTTNNSSSTIKEESPLHLAIKNQKIELVQLLLSTPNIKVNLMSKDNSNSWSSSGIQNNYNNTTDSTSSNDNILEKAGLHLAIENNYLEIVQLLLAHKDIDVNKKYIKFSKF